MSLFELSYIQCFDNGMENKMLKMLHLDEAKESDSLSQVSDFVDESEAVAHFIEHFASMQDDPAAWLCGIGVDVNKLSVKPVDLYLMCRFYHHHPWMQSCDLGSRLRELVKPCVAAYLQRSKQCL